MIANEHRFTYTATQIADAADARADALQPELDELVGRAAELRVTLNQAIDLAIESALCHEVLMDEGWLRPVAVLQPADGFAEPRRTSAILHLDRDAWDRYSYVDRSRRELLAKIANYRATAARYRSQDEDLNTGGPRLFDLDADDVRYFGLDQA